ncbi:MAG: di-heme enzyme [Deltaproteobacteria bacterium]|nr:di-heme enzyme [Deltaproteobacteria bacterium]
MGARSVVLAAGILVGMLVLGGGVRSGRADGYRWTLPEGLGPPPVPPDNPMSEEKVALGRRLFADVRLSFNRTTSCATCHDPARELTDGLPRAIGASGEPHARNTPSLWNVAYNVTYTWIDQGLDRLEDQLRLPLTGTSPVEMGFGPGQVDVLAADPEIAVLHRAAFGDAPLDETTVVQALASYVRTLIRMDSAFDRRLYWDDPSDFDATAASGMALFFSERLGCGHCHAGLHLSGPTAEPGRAVMPVFHRTAVSDSSESFRAPSLRFVGRTAPYMHDGSLATLAEVVAFYERGGGRDAERLRPFALSPAERAALLAFLASL